MKPKYLAMRLPVLDKTWIVYYCSKRYFDKKHKEEFDGSQPSGTLAFMVADDKRVFFRANKLSRETIIHELVHCYLWELCLWSLRHKESEAPIEEVEEAFCDMMAKYGKTLLGQADKIIDAYAILKDKADSYDVQDS